MPEEICEQMMIHALKDKVREAYFLADPNELEKVYLKYMDNITISNTQTNSPYNSRIDEMEAVIMELKKKYGRESLRSVIHFRENMLVWPIAQPVIYIKFNSFALMNFVLSCFILSRKLHCTF